MLLHCTVKTLKNTEQKRTHKRGQNKRNYCGKKLYIEQMPVDIALMKPSKCYTFLLQLRDKTCALKS